MTELIPPASQEIPAEMLTVGMIIDDERFSHLMQVGHVGIGPKWVTARSFHPDANVYPNSPYQIRRGDKVRIRVKEPRTLARITVDLELRLGATPEEEEENMYLVEDLEDRISRALNDPQGRIISWQIRGEWPEVAGD